MFNIFAGVFGGFWRRIFGGWLENIPIINKRAVQHGVAVLFLLPAFLWFGMPAGWAVYAIIVIQGLFWARGHGAYFDSGRGEVNHYDEVWYDKYVWAFVQWLGDKLNRNFGQYGKMHDFCGMVVRYTLPTLCLLPVMVLCYMSFWGLSLGIIVAGVYAGMSYLKDWGIVDKSSEYSEFIVGMIATMMWFI